MEELLKQIKKALDQNLYYLALFVSLALPDICGALQSENGNASSNKYIDWFNINVRDKYPAFTPDKEYILTGEDCYCLRCSFLHQGKTKHKNSSYSKIVFMEPDKNDVHWHMNISNDVLQLDAFKFCTDMINSVQKWLINNLNNSTVKNNLNLMIKRYPEGIIPHFVGVHLIS